MSSIALLGGSFNPPHVAHQMICLWALSTGVAEQVWLIPCHRHPFGKPLVDFAHRREMCRLAAGDFMPGRVLVSSIEEEMGGESRTVFTLRRLRDEHPEHKFSLLIGADILQERHTWYQFEEIERLAEIVVVGRTGFCAPPGYQGIELPAISSTMIREALDRGGDVRAYLPSAVRAYIAEHGLYS